MVRTGDKQRAAARGGAERRAHPGRARGRRTGQDARLAILEAAEQRLLTGGPDAVRLKEIAADVGIAHPTILHHFGSREGLNEALVEHIMRRLQKDLMEVVSQAPVRREISDRVERTAHMLELTVRTLRERGLARLMAWLVLSGEDLRPLVRGMFVGLPHVLHAARVERRRVEGRSIPSLEDTLFGTAMMMITMFGDVLMGPTVRAAVGLEDTEEVGRRFRRWMARGAEAYEPSTTSEPKRRG